MSLKVSLLEVFVCRCDVFTAVRKLRAQRQGMIQDLVSDYFPPYYYSGEKFHFCVSLVACNPRNTAQTVSRVRPQLWLWESVTWNSQRKFRNISITIEHKWMNALDWINRSCHSTLIFKDHCSHHQSESCSGCIMYTHGKYPKHKTSCCGCHETNIAPDATPLQSPPPVPATCPQDTTRHFLQQHHSFCFRTLISLHSPFPF